MEYTQNFSFIIDPTVGKLGIVAIKLGRNYLKSYFFTDSAEALRCEEIQMPWYL